MNVLHATSRPVAGVAVALVLAACSVDNETLGTRPDPAEGSMFRRYVAIGTSIGAGLQSGGINDSTQREAYPYLLAQAMGLTPGVDWEYPAFTNPGCPPPYSDIRTRMRVSGDTVSTRCLLRSPASVAPLMNNASIPGMRAKQAISLTDASFPNPQPFALAQFITGSLSPLEVAGRQRATFVTLEVGSNDVLLAALGGTAAGLTPLADFQASFTTIADSLDAMGAGVAVSNVPNVTLIPHFSAGVVFFCLKTGSPGCPVPATPPYNSPNFTVSATCAPGGAAPGAVGDSMLVAFTGTATITSVLAAGGAANLDCGAGTATVTTGAGTAPTGPVLSATTVRAIATRVGEINAFIQAQATTRNWAVVDFNGLLASNAAQIPRFPGFSAANPQLIFGTLFSQDGIHPNGTSHRTLAQAFATAINTRYGTTLTVP